MSTSAAEPAYAKTSGHFAAVVALFCGLLVISNVGATKLISVGHRLTIGPIFGDGPVLSVGPLITDGGAFLFPLVYVLGDVMSEVYGWRATRRTIWLAFALSGLAALTFLAVQAAPPSPDWPNQEAFEAILGFVPRIVIASLAGFLCGQMLNAWVLVRIKARTDEPKLWVRLLGSTGVGELIDTVVFCTIAFYGVLTGWHFVNYVITGYFYKVGVEILVMPITYRVIALLKRHEPTYGKHDPEPVVPILA